MNTTPTSKASASMVLLAMGASFILSSCAMPPRQAWTMIQREGLFNYWAQAYGNTPAMLRPSPPLQAASRPFVSRTPHLQPQYQATSDVQAKSQPDSSSSQLSSAALVSQPSAAAKPAANSTAQIPLDYAADTKSTAAGALPKNPPAPVPTPAPSAASTTPPPGVPLENKELPYGTAVAGRPNMVNSPYASKTQLVDVAGMSAGQTVKCPYSGKLFRVPPTQQAAYKAELKPEMPAAKVEEKTKLKTTASEAPSKPAPSAQPNKP